MKKRSFLGLMAATTLTATMAVTTAYAAENTPAVVFDLGGKFDKSFNQSAYDGAERFTKETGENLPDVGIVHFWHGLFPQQIALDIATRRGLTKHCPGDISLGRVHHESRCFAGFAEADRQHPGRKGIEGARVPGLAGLEQPADFLHRLT